MMVGAGANNTGNSNAPVIEANLQIGEDDISLGNRKIVLNFGEKDDDTEADSYK